MTPDTASVRLIVPGEMDPEQAFACLSNEERLRAGRFHFRDDALHWISCRAGLRHILGEVIGMPAGDVPIIISENGKPLLAPPFSYIHFNLSHCEDLAAVAWSTAGPVGIDLEPLRRAPDLLECVGIFCHPLEIAALSKNPRERANQLLEIWTAKEAILKALGSGLFTAPETLRIDFERSPAAGIPDTPTTRIEQQRIHRLQFLSTHHTVMLSVPETVVEIGTTFQKDRT